jgi:hypothetical protein
LYSWLIRDFKDGSVDQPGYCSKLYFLVLFYFLLLLKDEKHTSGKHIVILAFLLSIAQLVKFQTIVFFPAVVLFFFLKERNINGMGYGQLVLLFFSCPLYIYFLYLPIIPLLPDQFLIKFFVQQT